MVAHLRLHELVTVTRWKESLSAHDAPQNESSAETPETDGKQTSSTDKLYSLIKEVDAGVLPQPTNATT